MELHELMRKLHKLELVQQLAHRRGAQMVCHLHLCAPGICRNEIQYRHLAEIQAMLLRPTPMCKLLHKLQLM